MERVKSEVAAALLQAFGPDCVLELESVEQCLKVSTSREYVIYVRPDPR